MRRTASDRRWSALAEAAATCAVFAASNPDRVERLILYDPWARGVRDERERDEALAQIREVANSGGVATFWRKWRSS